jgi:hypothetical protein
MARSDDEVLILLSVAPGGAIGDGGAFAALGGADAARRAAKHALAALPSEM